MIDSNLYSVFVVLSVGIILLPGPNVLFIVATSLSSGRKAGLFAIAGTSSAMAIQLGVAAIGSTALVSVLADACIWVKWAGVAYLAYVGFTHLLAAKQASQQPILHIGMKGLYWQGFLVSLTNPKTILFFGAFLPQFVSSAHPPGLQLVVLSVSFFALAVALDSVYAFGASVVGRIVSSPAYSVGRNMVVGSLYLGASFGIAVSRRANA